MVKRKKKSKADLKARCRQEIKDEINKFEKKLLPLAIGSLFVCLVGILLKDIMFTMIAVGVVYIIVYYVYTKIITDRAYKKYKL